MDTTFEKKPVSLFKKVKPKNIRKKNSDDESDEDQLVLDKVEEMQILRKIRRKHRGVTAESLLSGNQKINNQSKDDHPYKVKTGGMLDLNALKNAPVLDDAYDTGIGTAFSAETNKRDEDAQMQSFIEENLKKRTGGEKNKDDSKNEDAKYLSPEEAALQSVPDYLRKSTAKKNEEMLSNQMLSGIPEVDLGVEAKIKNIEATEDAKQRLLKESMMTKEKPSEFVPKNMAVNFVQHSKTKADETRNKTKTEEQKEIVEPVVGGGIKISTFVNKRPNPEKPTDDLHYEKFRKHFKKH